jgi:cell division transport system ATP-binding protein
MGANDVHGGPLRPRLVGFVTSECYKATVNESETITDAKPACWRAFGPAIPAGFLIEHETGVRFPDHAPTELTLVRFENVGLRYGLGPEILRDLSFLIPAHSFQFLTGPSGAGKTSLLKLLFLSLRPTRGLVNLFGRDISLLGKNEIADMRKRIGIVLQDFRLLDHMTTYENVALPFRVMGREESSYRKEVIDLLRWVGLGERMDALPPILSGGEKQRAAIARAVISRPQLLLADEPTGNVDPTLGRRLLRLFIELNKTGTAVVIATHDITLMDQYEARRLVLHQGRLHIYE